MAFITLCVHQKDCMLVLHNKVCENKSMNYGLRNYESGVLL